VSELLGEQKRYYAARAPEYDDWWFRRGRYAFEPGEQEPWDADVAELEEALAAFRPEGEVLELAAGTGLWTRTLAASSSRLVAVDASGETLAINRARVAGAVEYVVADVFEWEPQRRFDLVFFSFWLSHVPEERFDEFWRFVRSALRPGGRVFLIDSGGPDPAQRSPTDGERQQRRLADGRVFTIVKRYWTPALLRERLRTLGFELALHLTGNGFFLYGGGG
jgi:SAM-dependent methyltransferase